MNLRRVRILLVPALAAIAVPASAKQCEPSGVFFRSHGDQLKVDFVDTTADPKTARISLMILGIVVRDAPTIGQAEGEMVLSQDQCLGVYSAGNHCTLVFIFMPKSAKIRQIGYCGFGAGANADGTFYRTTKPERYLP